MINKKWFVLSIILFGLIVNGFNFVVRSDSVKPVMVSESDFSLSSYKEKAEVNDIHVLEIDYDKDKISLAESDVSFKLVGHDSDISIFRDCVNLSYTVKDGKICFTGRVVKFGVYSVDVQPVIKNSLTLSKYAWWNSSYSNYRVITVNPSQSNTQTDFPVLVVLNSTISAKCNNGASIRFVYLDNETVLSHETEFFNASGDSYIWVKLNDINTSSKFLIYYNNPAAVDVSNANAVWDANYIGVFHMNQSSGSCFDSSGVNHGAFQGDMPTEKENYVGYSQYFDGTGDYITLPSGCMVTSSGSIEFYAKPDDITVRNRMCVFQQDADDFTQVVFYGDASPDKLGFNGKIAGVNQWDIYQSATYTNDFMYSGSVYQTNDALTILNGRTIGVDTSVIPTNWNYGNIYVGTDSSGTVFKGYIDEFRISDIRRSNAWLVMSYNTVNNRTGATPFLSIGGENTFVSPSFNVLPNVSSINFVNNSINIPICSNFSFDVYDENGDTITYTIEGNHDLCSMSGNMFNGTLWFNCTNCKWLGYNYTIWINLTDDNVSYHRYYFEFRTEECCFNLGDNMEINMELSQLVMLLLLGCWLFFTSLYYNSRQRNEVILAWVQFCFAMPLSFIIGGWVAPFVMGYAVAVIIPLLSLVILVDAMLSR